MSVGSGRYYRRGLAVPVGLALLFHGIIGGLLFLYQLRSLPVDVGVVSGLTFFRLVPPLEGDAPVYMASSDPDSMPPPGEDGVPDPEMVDGGNSDLPLENIAGAVSDAELAEILAADRVELRKELDQLSELADAKPAPAVQVPMPAANDGGSGGGGAAPEGAVRELDLSGYSQNVVDEIMKRYNLRVVTRRIGAGHRGQNFLSSASKGGADQFFGGMSVPEGIYEVFQLSRESVATMSRLEEQALRDEGLEPLKSRVVKIVFGIVKGDGGDYALGVLSLKAEAVSQ